MYGPIFPVNGRNWSVKILVVDAAGVAGGISFAILLKTKKTFCTNLKSNCINLRAGFIFILAIPLLN